MAAQRSHVAVLGCVLFGWDAEACEAERSLRVFVILGRFGQLGEWMLVLFVVFICFKLMYDTFIDGGFSFGPS